ncbi:hypothetical protein HD806DRAFT_379514 [Xylariaceae sp. AK1471]|nr:hypothetical protein HD806DRAFT_379514 [Xylariaceae sp. AK1471]
MATFYHPCLSHMVIFEKSIISYPPSSVPLRTKITEITSYHGVGSPMSGIRSQTIDAYLASLSFLLLDRGRIHTCLISVALCLLFHRFSTHPIDNGHWDIPDLNIDLVSPRDSHSITTTFNIAMATLYKAGSNQASPLVDMSGTAPGKRCPTCQHAGRETWVFAGRSCPICATYVP